MGEWARVRGLKESVAAIEALAQAAGEETVSGTRVVGETIMADVKASRPGAGVPVDKGPLRASGRVTGPDPATGVVRLTFGGASAPYALRQHETLEYRHEVGEARYLVRGLERFQAGGKAVDALRKMAEKAIARVAARRNRAG